MKAETIHTSGRLEIINGAYPGLHQITGLPFRVSFWTQATDISIEQSFERSRAAKKLIACWNACEGMADPEQAIPALVDALERSLGLIATARQHFPKSIRNNDRFSLENTCATVSKALAMVTTKETP